MIVLKAPQEALLAALEAVSGVVSRNLTKAEALMRNARRFDELFGSSEPFFAQLNNAERVQNRLFAQTKAELLMTPVLVVIGRQKNLSWSSRGTNGFFGRQKVDGRYAP